MPTTTENVQALADALRAHLANGPQTAAELSFSISLIDAELDHLIGDGLMGDAIRLLLDAGTIAVVEGTNKLALTAVAA